MVGHLSLNGTPGIPHSIFTTQLCCVLTLAMLMAVGGRLAAAIHSQQVNVGCELYGFRKRMETRGETI